MVNSHDVDGGACLFVHTLVLRSLFLRRVRTEQRLRYFLHFPRRPISEVANYETKGNKGRTGFGRRRSESEDARIRKSARREREASR
ncbi:hypothetical protein D9M72_594440 [compost metagenome]